MADINNDRPSFSIEETMDMGVGNTELIKDLMTPELVSGNADDLQPVIEEKKDEKPPKTEKKIEKKGGDSKEETTEEKETNQNLISNFLEENEDEEKDEKIVQNKTEKKEGVEEEQVETPSQFNALANDLYKLGIFTKDDEDEEPITTAEEFLEKFQNEKKKGATEAIKAIGF